MPLTIQLSNYRLVNVFVGFPIDGEITTKLDKNTLGVVHDEQAIVIEQRCFTLYTKHTYTVTVKNNKERYYHHSGSNVEELLWLISYSSAVFEIDTVYVYINSHKHVIEVYIPDDAQVIRNDYA